VPQKADLRGKWGHLNEMGKWGLPQRISISSL
jgi:hypothetical protein